MDAVPGRVNVVWNLFDKPGELVIQCREYCGLGHADMRAKLFVEPFTQTAEAATGETSSGANQTSNGTSPAATANQTSNGTSPAATATQTSGPPGTPLTILQGASVQGSPNYDPATLTIKKGDKITVTNKDNVPHTVTSGTGPQNPTSAKSFDTSIIEGGQSADITTEKLAPGELPYYCSVNPYMTGKLVVQ